MRRLSLTERFEQERQESLAKAEEERGPSPEERRAMKLLVDGFGLAQTEQLTPAMERILEELALVEKRDGSITPASAGQRLGLGPIPKFQMARPWDPTDPANKK